MNLAEAAAEVRRLSALLEDSTNALRTEAQNYANAENNYRKAKASAWVELVGTSGTVPEKQARVDAITADARLARDMAEGLRVAALEAGRSRRAQLDAIRSLLSAEKSEMELAR